jgi:hypothetical protein
MRSCSFWNSCNRILNACCIVRCNT